MANKGFESFETARSQFTIHRLNIVPIDHELLGIGTPKKLNFVRGQSDKDIST